MEALTFKLEQFDFDGPMDLIFKLIQKNKIDIRNLPIAVLCDQYLATIAEMESMDMDVAAEFLVMASELMLIKSKMMLPQEEKPEEDPRADLAELLMRYQQAKAMTPKLQKMHEAHRDRMVKDTDEISIDRTYVADQQITSLCTAIRRIASYQESMRDTHRATFTPMISTPIVPVELKIVGILNHMGRNKQQNKDVSLGELLGDSTSLPDMIAIFLGVLELVKMRQILIVDDPDEFTSLHGTTTRFVINDNPPPPPDAINEETAVDGEQLHIDNDQDGKEDRT
jgi:segregation and condensation protein A